MKQLQAFLFGYNTVNLEPGEELTVEQLLYLLLVPSANVVGNVLAEHAAGSTGSFATMMNEKAISLGCKGTNFINPYGLHDSNHYSTAYDLALIAKYAMQNNTFRNMVKTTSYTLPPTNKYSGTDRVFSTTNDLIKPNSNTRADNYYYNYATGIKTGYTTPAKNCLASSAIRDHLELICVVLGGEQTPNGLSHRFLDAKALFDYGFDTYTIRKLKEENSIVKQVEIKGASRDTKELDVCMKEELSVLTIKKDIDKIILPEVTLKEDLKAPISKGEIIGTITYTVEDISYTRDLIAGQDVKKSSSFLKVLFVFVLFVIILYLIQFINKSKRKKTYRVKTYHSV